MKEEYILYLDESENSSKKFTIAGFAIKKSNIPILEAEIQNVKKLIWDEEYIKQHCPILHSTDLHNVYRQRKQPKKSSVLSAPYAFFAQKNSTDIEKIYTQIYGRLSHIVRTLNITVFSCIIDMKHLQELFFLNVKNNGIHLIDDKYNIALQKIIENYTHFLTCSDGFGDVLYESRNTIGENSSKSPDIRLINNFHQIHANNRGIVYTNSKSVQERNRVFATSNKLDDVVGLQLADFIAYNILKFSTIKESSQVTDFMKQIHRASYNGGHILSDKDQRSFWGIRLLPSYPVIEGLSCSNKKLETANKNLKKERNKLKKHIIELEKENQRLQLRLSEMSSTKLQE